jgi:probable rRNA maturation factor
MHIDVEVDQEAWGPSDAAVRIIDAAVRAALETVSGASRDRAVSIILTGDDEAADLNQRHRRKPGATNVLSFPAREIPGLPAGESQPLGDIVLAAGVIRREAAEQGITVERHLARLVVHGTLHLLGCDHDTDEKSEQMQSLEVVALKRLDIALGERNDGEGSGADDAAPRDR